MAQLMDSITQSLGGDTMKQISRQLGADEGTTQNAIAAAVPLLLAGLARNSSSPDGAAALHEALVKDHDGGILDKLGGFLGNAQTGPGAGILGHVLGGHQPLAEEAVSNSSGLDRQRTGQLLLILAPIVMAMIGRARRQNDLNASGVAGMLGQEHEGLTRTSPGLMGLATKLFDKDGDGSITEELGGIAGKLFGGR
jgi:hypothetical protein